MTLRTHQNISAIPSFTVVIESLIICHLTCEKRLHAYAAKRQASITQAYHRQSPLSSSNESAAKCSICTCRFPNSHHMTGLIMFSGQLTNHVLLARLH